MSRIEPPVIKEKRNGEKITALPAPTTSSFAQAFHECEV